ncbi:hypothetical protein SAMN05444166_8364 [Singulisphaera sp. GP187]|uniref:hypothetical protein n=1 Tax=Singulisphaera sp. GP187 TaxID=1882752 RepID=UPI00092C3383|nr:hypothetical protein [Singulisphaera sp. GP187]SIO67442.1 hypothetical protein SAMN05444166_8364 [Singulisphaera sp. GP187]
MLRPIRFNQRADMLFEPMNSGEVGKRLAVRLGCCSIPYLILGWTFAVFVDDRLMRGFWYWYLVVLVPGAGLMLDLWRLRRTRMLQPKSSSI